MPTDRELDDLIDAALPGYAAAEPQPGLEHRILSHALAKPRPRRSLAWAWAFAVPPITCLLIFLILHGRRTLPRSELPTRATPDLGAPAPAPSEANIGARTPAIQPKAPHARSVMASHPATSEPSPKNDIFPSPSPLTAEEQALVAYNRAQLRATIAHSLSELEINPLSIAELQIKPLAITALDAPASSPSESGRNDQQP